ncbi:MAG: restriction endonuclease subunit S [Chromatiales bacterium]|nr:restriction endonuclease subunit S [Chromatiales bacterium]
MKLKQIADVAMGYSFRSRLERVDGGNISVIQMKDLSEDNQLEVSNLMQIDKEGMKRPQFVQQNDIVLRSRGQTYTAVLIDQDVGEAVLAAPLLRIRVGEAVLPAYLYWYINLPATQAWLMSQAEGTKTPMISKQVLEGMEVVVPPLKRQQTIVQLAALAADEQRLMQELARKRKQYMEGILMQAASGAR